MKLTNEKISTMLNFEIDELLDELERDEGRRKYLYQDTEGIWTIGIGYNIQEKGLPDNIINQLHLDVTREAIEETVKLFCNFDDYSANRQKALINMMFNLGFTRLSGFVKMRKAIANGDWFVAADEALDSKWAAQVGARAERIAQQLRFG